MTNQHELEQPFDANSSDSIHIIDTVDPPPACTITKSPQPQPQPQAAPIGPSTGFSSRYDSDYDDSSFHSDNDCCLFDESYITVTAPTDSSNHNSVNDGFMNSWISAATTEEEDTDTDVKIYGERPHTRGPRFVPPLLFSDDSAEHHNTEQEVKAIAIKPSSTLYLPSLPMDTIHRLASYLSCGDLLSLSLTTKRMGERCEEVWRRVRGHCGRCLGEVMFAWATGEHADARQLATLYLQNGVPIYPAPNGHAHHTIVWRMGLEKKALLPDDNDTSTEGNNDRQEKNANEKKAASFDPFYTAHYHPEEHHQQEEQQSHHHRPPYTYVEEKSIFYKTKEGIPLNHTNPATAPATLRPPSARGRNRRSTFDGGHVPPLGAAAAIRHALLLRQNNNNNDDDRYQEEERAFRPLRRSSFSSSSPTGYTTTSVNAVPSSVSAAAPASSPKMENNTTATIHPKLTLRVHRHLADQHLFNLPSIRGDALVEGTSMNLNADFFHPHIENSLKMRPPFSSGNNAYKQRGLLNGFFAMDETMRGDDVREEESWESLEGLPWNDNNEAMDWDLAGDLGLMHNPFRAAARASVADSSRMENYLYGSWSGSRVPYNSPASDVALQMYSAALPNLSDEKKDLLSKFRVRMAAHQRKLESCVLSAQEFNDALLDWWDELLPISAGIHFHNRQSPVPRMTHLQSFLTTPCPKALGVVQCEIERVKISSKKKLFPTYEYRLFIRDVKNDNPENFEGLPPRKDSVLLVAKNKLRSKGPKSSSVTSNTSTTTESKRGVTNYYMCLPQQRDVDSHYRSANKLHALPKSGLDVAPMGTDPVLGRVQGNFIGTEFQIFSPVSARKMTKSGRESSSSSSDDGSDLPQSSAASGRRRASVDTPSAKGKNSLARLARRASLTMTRRPSISTRRPSISGFGRQSMDPAAGSDDEHKNKAYRRLSFTKTNRTKRSAIANSELDCHRGVLAVEEEEVGAITYTANLLGNRPRIMDVCVPKLDEDGNPTHVWKKKATTSISENDEDGGFNNNNSRMLSQFKAMQAERDAREQQSVEADERITQGDDNGLIPPINEDDNGLMVLQNRPPWWNVEIGAFVLNFGGRVSVASVKNFQLVERTDQEHIMLQFGRISGRHSFTMDFQYPLTPMQSFAIAISSLQSKISFG